MIDIGAEVFREIAEEIFEENGFVMSSQRLIIYGICEDCNQKQKKEGCLLYTSMLDADMLRQLSDFMNVSYTEKEIPKDLLLKYMDTTIGLVLSKP